MNTLGTEAADFLEREMPTLVETITESYYRANPALWQRYGAVGRQHSINDTTYHLQFLISALVCNTPDIFSSYCQWAVAMLQARGVERADLAENLKSISEVLERRLPGDLYSIIHPHFSRAIDAIAAAETTPRSFLDGDFAHADIARQYLASLLARKRHDAVDAVVESAANGAALDGFYVDLFPRVQREVGRLWQLNRISVAEEHYCSAATQLAISQLYPYVRAAWKANRRGHRVVAACVGSELHEIGMRSVSDCLESHGWETVYLGANQPIQGVVDAVAVNDAKVLALSVSMAFNVRRLISFIEQVKSRTGVPILVGGHIFNQTEGLWRNVGADAFAGDAREAVVQVEHLAAA